MPSADSSYGFLLNVWAGDDPQYLRASLLSIVNQSFGADEVIIATDGHLTEELDDVLAEFDASIDKVYRFEKQGLSLVRNNVLPRLSTDYVLIQDADDISHPDRLRAAKDAIQACDQSPTIITTPMLEFDSNDGSILGVRPGLQVGPVSPQLRLWNPINHPTVILDRNQFLALGGYRHLRYLEDYLTWCSLLKYSDCSFATLNVPSVCFRVTENYWKRRAGIQFLKNELHLRHALKSSLPEGPQRLSFLLRSSFALSPPTIKKAIVKSRLRNKSHNLPTRIEEFRQMPLDFTKLVTLENFVKD